MKNLFPLKWQNTEHIHSVEQENNNNVTMKKGRPALFRGFRKAETFKFIEQLLKEQT